MNIGNMMKQAQQMQARMQAMQDQLEQVQMMGQAGNGAISVTLNGKAEMKNIKIDPAAVDASDTEMLEDLIVAAYNDAKNTVEAHVAEEMAKVTKGMQLPPGLGL